MGAGLLALLGAASWGTGDFLGGLAARRAHVLTVLVGSQLVGLAGAAVWVLASGDTPPPLDDVLPALGAGVAGAVGLAALYRGLAVGAMGVVAPISAASPVVPLVVDIAHGSAPTSVEWVGIALVLGGIVLLAREPGRAREGAVAAGVLLALLAALGFGLFIVGIDAASDASVPWALVCSRSASTVVALAAVLIVAAPVRPAPAILPIIAAVGLFDTLANAFVASATTKGSAGIVAVLSALYPVTTIALARVVIGERLDRPRAIGAAIALSGAAVVALG